MIMNHHRVPEFYLKGFLTKYGKLTICNKESPDRLHCRPIRQLCAEPDYFALDGTSNDSEKYCLENELSQTLEYEAADILSKIRQNKTFEGLSVTDIKLFLDWIAWLIVANFDRRKIIIKHNSLFTDTQKINALVCSHDKIRRVFFVKTWRLMVCDSSSLITSDNPVIIQHKMEGLRDIETLVKSVIFFPLAPNLLLRGYSNEERMFLAKSRALPINMRTVDLYNVLTLNNARDMVIASDKSIMQDFLNRMPFT